MPEDARNRFDEDVFLHRVTKDGRLLISVDGRVVTTVAGAKARKLIASIDASDRRQVQHWLARATGHYKHGNERQG